MQNKNIRKCQKCKKYHKLKVHNTKTPQKNIKLKKYQNSKQVKNAKKNTILI